MTQKTCAHISGGNYCPRCGKQLVLSPIDSAFLLEQYAAQWMLKGFRNTVLGLIVRPGHLVREYLLYDRDLLIKPITYLALCAAVLISVNDRFPTTAACESWEQWGRYCILLFKHIALVQLPAAATSGIIVKYAAFRHEPYGFFEILSLFLYILAQTLLISAVFALAEGMTGIQGFLLASIPVKIAYVVVAMAQFFNRRSIGGYVVAAGAVVLSSVLIAAAVVAFPLIFEGLRSARRAHGL